MQSQASQGVVLSVLYWAALSDGDLDEAELDVLRKAADLFGGLSPEESLDLPASNSPQPPLVVSPSDEQLGDLLSSIVSVDDRQLLVKLAYQIVSCSRRDVDIQQINADEKSAYRRIVNASRLSQEMIGEAEWAGKSELEAKKLPSDLIAELIEKVKSIF
jgi:DnaJ-domain-containing protein 1